MLSVFPTLLSFSLLGTFLLRLAVGFFFVSFGFNKLWRRRAMGQIFFKKAGIPIPEVTFWIVSIAEFVGGIMLIGGIYTQAVALVFSVLLITTVILASRKPELFQKPRSFYVLLLVVTCSLLFLGAGLFAFDLPL